MPRTGTGWKGEHTLRRWIIIIGASLAIAATLGVLALAIHLLIANWRGRPVAAAFTRVAGATRVETAVAASRFWLTPPQLVVTTSADASQQVMWWAAHCAMLHDAPLLFTSPDRRRQQLVDATIKRWRREATPKHTAPHVIEVRDVQDEARCLASGHRADISGLSTPYIPDRPLPLRIIPVQATLAPVVVFAAAKAPGDPPDVAIGMALAAHMATPDRPVSLVVVPRYLGADPELASYLRNQRELVQGGIALGRARVLPGDTSTLLRQLLTAANRQDFWSQLQADLGTLGSLIAALLALLGLGAATTALALAIRHQVNLLREPGGRAPDARTGGRTVVGPLRRIWPRDKSAAPEAPEAQQAPAATEEPNWFTALEDVERGRVTVVLRSGWQVTGDFKGRHAPGEGQDPANIRAGTVVRLDNAILELSEMKLACLGEEEKPRPKDVEFVLVQVGDIELITRVRVKPPAE